MYKSPPPPPPNIHFYLPSFSFYLFSFTFQKKKIFFLGGGEFKPPAQLIPSQKNFTILPPLKHPFSSSFSFYLFSFTFPKNLYIFFFFGGGGGLNHHSYVHICPPPHMFLSFFTLKQNGKTPCR